MKPNPYFFNMQQPLIGEATAKIVGSMMTLHAKKFDTKLKGQVFPIEDLLNKHEDMRLSLEEFIKYSSPVIGRKISAEQMRQQVVDEFSRLTNYWPTYWVVQFQNGRTLTTDDFVDGETPEEKLINLSGLFNISPEIMTIDYARQFCANFNDQEWNKSFVPETIAFKSLDSLEKVYYLFRKQHEVTGMAVPVMHAVPTPEQSWRKFCLSEVL